jgi:hypothetical protein
VAKVEPGAGHVRVELVTDILASGVPGRTRIRSPGHTAEQAAVPGDATVLTPAEVEARLPQISAGVKEPQPITEALVPHRAGR